MGESSRPTPARHPLEGAPGRWRPGLPFLMLPRLSSKCRSDAGCLQGASCSFWGPAPSHGPPKWEQPFSGDFLRVGGRFRLQEQSSPDPRCPFPVGSPAHRSALSHRTRDLGGPGAGVALPCWARSPHLQGGGRGDDRLS